MKKSILLFAVVLSACTSSPKSAQEIVDGAIQYAGVKKLKNANASFTFRGIDYEYQYRNGQYRYIRIQTDTTGNVIKDVLVNSGLNRFINGEMADITDQKKAAYTSSVNSVIYFAFLPMSLNDEAVIKSYVREVDINGKRYHKVKVTFEAEGGGEDYEDIFYYWFDTEDYSMDFLAYSYNEEDGTGIRFREAFNPRIVNGVRIQDYKNFKPKVKGNVRLEDIDHAYMNEELELLSLIELENMEIRFNL